MPNVIFNIVYASVYTASFVSIFLILLPSCNPESLYIDDIDLGRILDEVMLSLKVEVEDGSIEQVAKKLIIMYKECLEGSFRSIENLGEAGFKQAARPHVVQGVIGDKDEVNDEDNIQGNIFGHDNSSSMMLDMPKSESKLNSGNTSVNGLILKATGEADDG